MAVYMTLPFSLDKPSENEWVTEADKILYEGTKSVKEAIQEGGGGTTYEAGDGIEITSDNVINVLAGDIVDGTTLSGSGHQISVNTTNIATKNDLNSYNPKDNFKTINNNSIVGTGNIEIKGGAEYTEGTGIDISTSNVISVEDSIIKDISDLKEAVWPYSISATGGGNYEIGRSINGSSTITVKRNGESVTGMTVTASTGTMSGYSWSKSNITSNTTVTFSLSGTTKTTQISFKFYYYRYARNTTTAITTTTEAENYIKNSMATGTSSSYKTLSDSISLDKTALAKDNYYIFCVPQTDPDKYIEWTVNHAETGGEIGYQVSGTIELPLVYSTSTKINYEYVVVPASSMAWNFKITGTLKNKA